MLKPISVKYWGGSYPEKMGGVRHSVCTTLCQRILVLRPPLERRTNNGGLYKTCKTLQRQAMPNLPQKLWSSLGSKDNDSFRGRNMHGLCIRQEKVYSLSGRSSTNNNGRHQKFGSKSIHVNPITLFCTISVRLVSGIKDYVTYVTYVTFHFFDVLLKSTVLHALVFGSAHGGSVLQGGHHVKRDITQ